MLLTVDFEFDARFCAGHCQSLVTMFLCYIPPILIMFIDYSKSVDKQSMNISFEKHVD